MPPTDPNLPPDFDPSDPVHQTLQVMAQDGSLPQAAPAAQHLPPSGFVDTLMHNLVHNSVAAQDSGMIGRGVAALFDVLNAPHAAVQAALGITPESQMEWAKRMAASTPAPSWMELLGGPGGFAQFGAELGSGIDNGRRWSPEAINIGADIVGDPTSYIGVGLFKNLGKTAAKVGLPRAAAVLGKVAVGDEAASDFMGKAAQGVITLFQKGLIPINAGLAKQWPQLVKWTDYYKTEQAMGLAVQWLTTKKGWDLPALRYSLTQTGGNMAGIMTELPSELQAQVNPQHLAVVIAGIPAGAKPSVARIGVGLPKNPQNDPMLALEGYRRWLQKDMGLSDPNAMNWYGEFNDWFKKQALGSLNYLLQNLQGGAAMGQMVGVDAGKTLAEAVDQSGNIARGVPFNTAGATAIANKTGLPIPYALHEQADRALNSVAGRVGRNNTTRDTLALGVLGGIGAGVPGALLGAAMGSRVAAVSDRIRKSSQGIETVLRERGWETGISRELVKNLGDMERIVVDGLTATGARASGRAVHPTFIDTITNQIKANGGQINTEDLRHTLVNSVRVTQDRADDIVRQLDDVLYTASRKGVDLSNQSNFDYQDLSALERVISDAFPFSVWFMKASPFFAEQAARHPLIGNLVTSQRATSAQMQDERGLPGRFSGTQRNSTGSAILSAIVGRPLEFYNDPLRSFIPFAGASQALTRLQDEDPETQGIADHLYHALDVLGLQPAPLVDVGLRTLGLVGQPDDPARGYLRWAGPAAGATALASRGVEVATGENPGWNVDVNRGPERIQEILRQALTGQEVTKVLDVQSERRVDELALRETGHPIGSDDPAVAPFVTARRTHAGPIWDQAKTEVELEKGIQSLSGFVSQQIQPQAILTPEEQQIRTIQKTTLLKPQMVAALDKASERTPTAPADPQIRKAVREAVLSIADRSGMPTPQSVLDRLADPTNANLNWIAGEVYKWEIDQNEMVTGYGPSGTPEERQIGNASMAMGQAGNDLTPTQIAERITANRAGAITANARGPQYDRTGPIHAALQIPGQERDAIKAATPLYTEYLAWKKIHPGLEVKDFLAEKFHK